MTENEKKFYNKLYDEIVKDIVTVVNEPKDRDEKIKIVKNYLSRIKNMETRVLSSGRDNDINLLKSFYYNKYIIKKEDIPDSYYDMQAQIAFERGYGKINITDTMKEEMAATLIQDQKKSLDTWLDYFFSEDSKFYPYELKLWAFQGMLKMGAYDKKKEEFTRRGKTTTSTFIELNHEALALTINQMNDYLKGKTLEDKDLDKVLSSERFSKIYKYNYNKLMYLKKDETNSNEGIWVKYNKGTDHMPLVKSLEGRGTGWCTAGEETARQQLANGDFYAYYTKDENGEYKIPRIAIRMEGSSIGEIRGVASHQNLEPEMEEIVEEKLKEFPDRDKYKKKVHDMKLMTYIYNKQEKGEELTKDELRFLYETDSKILGFGYEEDPRIKEIKSKRNVRRDVSNLINCNENEVALNQQELDENPTHFIYLDGDLREKVPTVNYTRLRYVSGDTHFESLTSAQGLENLTSIGGYAEFNSLTSAKGLESLTSIGGYADFVDLTSAKGLENLTSIGGGAYFYDLTSARGLESLTSIGGYADFKSLTSAEGLENLTIIGETARFESLTSLEGLENLQSINGIPMSEILSNDELRNKYFPRLIMENEVALSQDELDKNPTHFIYLDGDLREKVPTVNYTRLRYVSGATYFRSLTSAQGLESLETIGGVADFVSLTSAEGLEKLTSIGRFARFDSLTSAKGLENLTSIWGDAYFSSLTTAKGLENLILIEGNVDFRSLTSAEGLKSLETIGGHADFESLTNAEGLENLTSIGGGAYFSSLTSAEGLEKLASIGGDGWFRTLTSAQGLENLASIGGSAHFNSLTSAKGLENLTIIGKTARFESLTSLEGLENLQSIGGIPMSEILSNDELRNKYFPSLIMENEIKR